MLKPVSGSFIERLRREHSFLKFLNDRTLIKLIAQLSGYFNVTPVGHELDVMIGGCYIVSMINQSIEPSVLHDLGFTQSLENKSIWETPLLNYHQAHDLKHKVSLLSGVDDYTDIRSIRSWANNIKTTEDTWVKYWVISPEQMTNWSFNDDLHDRVIPLSDTQYTVRLHNVDEDDYVGYLFQWNPTYKQWVHGPISEQQLDWVQTLLTLPNNVVFCSNGFFSFDVLSLFVTATSNGIERQFVNHTYLHRLIQCNSCTESNSTNPSE